LSRRRRLRDKCALPGSRRFFGRVGIPEAAVFLSLIQKEESMKNPLVDRTLTVVLTLCAMAIWAGRSHAQTAAPRYVGTVSLSNVQKTTAMVTATVNVTVQDQTGAAITNPSATISFPNMGLHREVRLNPLSPPALSVATFQAATTMSSAEYSRWQLAVPPVVTLQFVDSSGKTARETVQLTIVHTRDGVTK